MDHITVHDSDQQEGSTMNWGKANVRAARKAEEARGRDSGREAKKMADASRNAARAKADVLRGKK